MKYLEKSTGAFLGGLMLNFTALVISIPTVGDGTVGSGNWERVSAATLKLVLVDLH